MYFYPKSEGKYFWLAFLSKKVCWLNRPFAGILFAEVHFCLLVVVRASIQYGHGSVQLLYKDKTYHLV